MKIKSTAKIFIDMVNSAIGGEEDNNTDEITPEISHTEG